VSRFESNRSKLVSVECALDSKYASPAKRRYGKTNLVQCSISGSWKSLVKVMVFREKQTASVQQLECEDDQHTQECGLEIENISSTVFIL
jgi:hypothetical protein